MQEYYDLHRSFGSSMQLAAVALPLLALNLWAAAAMAPPMVLPGCPTTCGNVSVPYPFGISAGCFLPGFNLTCDHGHDQPRLLLDHGSTPSIQVTDIYLDNATMRVISGPGAIINQTTILRGTGLRLPIDEGGPYVLSYDHNEFIAVGCGVYAMLLDPPRFEDKEAASCFSECRTYDRSHWMLTEDGGCSECSSNGCCKASISTFSPSYAVLMVVLHPEKEVLTSAAFIAEQGWIDGHWCRMAGLSWPFGARPPPPDLSTVPVVLEWAMNSTQPTSGMLPDDISRCPTDNDGATSACKSNHSMCVNMNNLFRSGYSCRCSTGYYGNPYLNYGCQDIDECANPEYYGCYGECVNMPGTFLCRCPHGSHGNSSIARGCVKSSTGLSIGLLGVGSGAMVFLICVGTTFIVRKIKAQRKKKLRETFFKQNHGQLLQQLVCHMADIGERMIVTLDEIEKATNNFDKSRELGDGGHGTVYKGILSSQHVVAIKKSKIVIQREINEFINEVAILSQVNHRNIVKLLGCCLETEVPLLIYEFISNGTLYSHLHVDAPLSITWKDRLRIAVETARALTYLHSLVSMPIIHRDIKSPNILLDDNLTVKLSDFGASRYIPIDQEGIHTTVQGTLGYLDPMYYSTGHITEKSDVYSFGVLLIELLTRKKPVSYRSSEGVVLVNHFLSLLFENNIDQILDPQVTKEGDGEVVDIALLAAICVKFRGEERPTMRQVEMTLESIQASKEFSSDVTDDDISSETI